MRRFSSRDVRRMMDRMGMNAKPMPEVEQVVFRTAAKDLIVENPAVTIIDLQGQKVFQVVGEGLKEVEKTTKEVVEDKVEITEEDIQLVAQQAGVSLDKAKVALEETKGNLAQAILMLTATQE